MGMMMGRTLEALFWASIGGLVILAMAALFLAELSTGPSLEACMMKASEDVCRYALR